MNRTNGYMDQKVIGKISTDRYLGVFSPPTSEFGDELNEDDVFWTGDFAEKKCRPESRQSPTVSPFKLPEKFGILAALTEDGRQLNQNQNRTLLYRKSSISPSKSSASRLIPSIPKPEREFSQTMPFKKFQLSVPVNVPLTHNKPRNFDLPDVDAEIDEEEEMLPPHEIVAKGYRSPKTTFSVLEGFGRTLKGRDLRQVRNAVWRKTGFLDS